MTKHDFNPDWRVAPGETLQSVLDDRNLTRQDLVQLSGLPLPTVLLLLSGVEPLTEPIADALERATNITAQFWLNLEAGYRKPPDPTR